MFYVQSIHSRQCKWPWLKLDQSPLRHLSAALSVKWEHSIVRRQFWMTRIMHSSRHRKAHSESMHWPVSCRTCSCGEDEGYFNLKSIRESIIMTTSNLTAIASLVSEIWRAMETQTDRHTHTDTVWSIVNLFKSVQNKTKKIGAREEDR